MSNSKVEYYAAHPEGSVIINFSSCGKFVYSSGSDLVLLNLLLQDDSLKKETELEDLLLEPITSLVPIALDKVLVGCEDGSVSLIQLKAGTSELKLRRSLPIRQLSSPNNLTGKGGEKGRKVVVVSDDMVLKLLDLDTWQLTSLFIPNQPIASVQLDSVTQNLYGVSTDGSIYHWNLTSSSNIDDGDEEVLKPIRSLPKVVKPTNTSIGESLNFSIHPNFNILVVPSVDGASVTCIDLKRWSVGTSLPSTQQGKIHTVKFSPNGQFCCSLSQSNQVLVWYTGDQDFTKWKVVKQFQHDFDITSVSWSPVQDTLAYGDSSGQVCVYFDLLAEVEELPLLAWPFHLAKKAFDLSTPFNINPTTTLDQRNPTEPTDLPNLQTNLEDLELDHGIDLDEDLDLPDHLLPNPNPPNVAQSAFQPGSTFVEDAYLQFLTFNELGYITTSQPLNQPPSFQVYLHQKTPFLDLNFKDRRKFSLGSLTSQGFALGLKLDEAPLTEVLVNGKQRKQRRSVLFYRNFQGFSANLQWEIRMEEAEDIISLVATPHGPIVITSRGFLRRFTPHGHQLDIQMVPSPTVLISTSNQEDLLFLVYHRSQGENLPRLGYQLIDLKLDSLVGEGHVPMVQDTALEWVGFHHSKLDSLDGLDEEPELGGSLGFVPGRTPILSDSNGLVQALNPTHGIWKPVGQLDPQVDFPYQVVDSEIHVCIVTPDPTWLEQPKVRTRDLAFPTLTSEFSDRKEVSQLMLRRHVHSVDWHNFTALPSTSHPSGDRVSNRKDVGLTLEARELLSSNLNDRSLLQLIYQASQTHASQLILDLVQYLRTKSLDKARQLVERFQLAEVSRRIDVLRKWREEQGDGEVGEARFYLGGRRGEGVGMGPRPGPNSLTSQPTTLLPPCSLPPVAPTTLSTSELLDQSSTLDLKMDKLRKDKDMDMDMELKLKEGSFTSSSKNSKHKHKNKVNMNLNLKNPFGNQSDMKNNFKNKKVKVDLDLVKERNLKLEGGQLYLPISDEEEV